MKKKSSNTKKAVSKTRKSLAKFSMPKKLREWIRESQFLATTLSIILTFGTTGLVEHCQRINDRNLSAMMVLSSIENFSSHVDKMALDMARCDTIGTWLLSLPQDSLDQIQPQEVRGIIKEMLSLVNFMSHDKTAENIFGNSFQTWKNMGSQHYLFIENVGACFARMNADETNWNEWVSEYETTINKVLSEMQPGEHTLTKLLNDNGVRQKIESFHVKKTWLDFISAHNRYLNKKNMASIGIDEKEIMEYTNKRKLEILTDEEEPEQITTSQLKRDSLTTLRPIIQHIDSIIKGQIKKPQ